MGLTGKWVRQVEIKSDGDVFYELFTTKPYLLPNICPDQIQNVDLHEGDWGHVGSTIIWTFAFDGKEETEMDGIEAVDEKKKSVTYKFIEGRLLGAEYKSFIYTLHLDTKGEKNLVTWTIDYEKLNEDVPDPEALMDYLISITKEIEAHYLQQ